MVSDNACMSGNQSFRGEELVSTIHLTFISGHKIVKSLPTTDEKNFLE